MVLVRGNDTYVAIKYTDNSSWGVGAGSDRRLNLIGDSAAVLSDVASKDEELGDIGARGVTDVTKQWTAGSITVNPYYNSASQWALMTHCMAMERVVDNKTIHGVAITGTACQTHLWVPQDFGCLAAGSVGGRTFGTTMYWYKAGQDNPATEGYYDYSDGIMITGFRWEQPARETPTLTYNVLGLKMEQSTGSSPGTVETSLYPVLSTDLGRLEGTSTTFGKIYIGQDGNVAHDIHSFSINVDMGFEVPPAYTNLPDEVGQPFHVNPVSVSGEFVLPAKQINAPAPTLNQPYLEYLNEVASIVRIRYGGSLISGASAGGGNVQRAIDIQMQNVIWTSAEYTIGGAGEALYRASFECAQGENISHAGVTDTYNTQIMIQVLNETTSGLYVPAARGGNDIQANSPLKY